MAWLERHKKSDAWIVFWRINGKKQRKYIEGKPSKDELKAEKAEAAKIEANAKMGKMLPAAQSNRKAMTFAQFAPLYLEWRKVHMPDSYETVSIRINAALDTFGPLRIADDQPTIDRWNDVFNNWVTRRATEVEGATLWGEWKDIKAALYRAARTGGKTEGRRWNLCATSPAANLVIGGDGSSVSDEKVAFTPDELDAIYAADPVLAPVWRFLANTGLRRSELSVLPVKNVDLDDEKARVRVVHDPEAGLKVKGASGRAKSRSVPLNTEARAARDQILADHDGSSLFLPQMHPRTWTKKFAKAVQAAGLDRGTLHSLRHTFISRAANNGVALHLVSKWAGHSELATTMKYLHVNEDYEWIEMQKMLSNEAANEKVVALDEYRKAS